MYSANSLRFITDTKGFPGIGRLRYFLRKENIIVSKTTVHKYMNQELQLFSIVRRKRPGFKKNAPNDRTDEQVDNLAVITHRNVCQRQECKVGTTCFVRLLDRNILLQKIRKDVIASVTGKSITAQLAIDTLKKVLNGRSGAGIILHSDQSGQFTSKVLRIYCKSQGIVQIMSRAGYPYDNAPMKRYFNTLKNELTYHYSYRTEAQRYTAVSDFAHLWYNLVRLHSHKNGLPPVKKRAA